MNDGKSGVSQMLENYRILIRCFAIGEISPARFEIDFVALFKNDSNQVTGNEFDVLDGLFADVDDYVDDPALRENTGGLGGEELRERAREVYSRLYDDQP